MRTPERDEGFRWLCCGDCLCLLRASLVDGFVFSGTKIVSSLEFCPLNFRITDRNLSGECCAQAIVIGPQTLACRRNCRYWCHDECG